MGWVWWGVIRSIEHPVQKVMKGLPNLNSKNSLIVMVDYLRVLTHLVCLFGGDVMHLMYCSDVGHF